MKNEKRNVTIVVGGIVYCIVSLAWRIKKLDDKVNALQKDFLDHLEEEFQEAVDETFEDIVERYDDI